jgi:hypothetical protein
MLNCLPVRACGVGAVWQTIFIPGALSANPWFQDIKLFPSKSACRFKYLTFSSASDTKDDWHGNRRASFDWLRLMLRKRIVPSKQPVQSISNPFQDNGMLRVGL